MEHGYTSNCAVGSQFATAVDGGHGYPRVFGLPAVSTMASAGERCLASLQASYLAGLADSRSGSLLNERPISNLVEIVARSAQTPELTRAKTAPQLRQRTRRGRRRGSSVTFEDGLCPGTFIY